MKKETFQMRISKDTRSDLDRVNSISWNGANLWIYARYSCGLGYYHKVGDNNYFFTKEEAEKALKEKENNKK